MNVTLIGALRRIERLRLRAEFFRSWEVALRATKDAGQALAIMDAPGSAELEGVRDYLLEGIGKGRPLGVVTKLRPDLFPVLDQLLIATGEGFGTLHDSLRLLSEYYLKDYARMARIRGWIGVPLAAAVVASFVLPIPLLWDVGRWTYSLTIIGSVVGIYTLGGIPASLLYSLVQHTSRVRRPRFAWTLAIGLEGGLTFAGAARLAATVAEMDGVGRHLDGIQSKVLKTMSLSKMLEGSNVWPAMREQVAKADEMSEYLSTLRVFAEHLESPP